MEMIKVQVKRATGPTSTETVLDCLHNAIENFGSWENALRLSGWDNRHQSMFRPLEVVPVNPYAWSSGSVEWERERGESTIAYNYPSQDGPIA